MKKYILLFSLFLFFSAKSQFNFNTQTVTCRVNNTVTTNVTNTISAIFTNTSALATSANQLNNTSTLTLIKQKQDTVNQNLRRLQVINTSSIANQTNQITNTNTLVLIKQKLDTVNQNLRVNNLAILNSVLSSTFFTGGSMSAVVSSYTSWISANPSRRVIRTSLISPNVATREILIEFK